MTATVRPFVAEDTAPVLSVVRAAFAGADRDGNEEVEIVRATRAHRSTPGLLELVADEAGLVIGHVMAAMGDLSGHEVPGVAPLSVAPAHQRSGVGSALMKAVISGASEHGWPLLLLLGDPAYYVRFGFEPASALGITYPPAGEDSPHFLALRLHGYRAALRGTFRYCWETT
jgi:putative acetyltransferase